MKRVYNQQSCVDTDVCRQNDDFSTGTYKLHDGTFSQLDRWYNQLTMRDEGTENILTALVVKI